MGFKDRFNDIKPAVSDIEPETQIKNYSNPITESLTAKLSAKIASVPIWFEYSEEEKKNLVASFLETWLRESGITISQDEKTRLINSLSEAVYGFGILDSLLADNSVTSVILAQNSPVMVCKNGELISSDLEIPISDVVARMLKLSGVAADKPVLKFVYKNLIITMILPPVSEPFIQIKKKTRKCTDFEFLLRNNKIDEKILSFLTSLIDERKSILISGSADSGKTSYAEAFCAVLNKFVLLQNTKFIDAKSFICGTLDGEELQNLVSALSAARPDYFVCDMNSGYNRTEGAAVISTIRAESAVQAVNILAANETSVHKLTEKQAKAGIASIFDYIIQLDADLYISTIAQFALNKAGSLIMNEILTRNDDVYVYDFPEQAPISAEPESKVRSGSFKSRFN